MSKIMAHEDLLMVSFKDGKVVAIHGNYTTYPSIEQVQAVADYAKLYVKRYKNNETIDFLNYKAEKEFDERVEKEEQRMREERRKEKESPRVFMTNIYLMFDSIRGVYKIGKADNAQVRFNQLKTANAGIKLLCAYYADGNCEKYLHKYFKEKHVSGEWFELDDFDLTKFHGFFERLGASITQYKVA